MASNLACVGLAVDDSSALSALVASLMPQTASIGLGVNGTEIRRWDDESGSRMVLGIRDRDVVDLLPSFAGPLSSRLAEVSTVSDEFAVADVVGEDEMMTTRLQFALEEQRFLQLHESPVQGRASMVALGSDVVRFDDAGAFGEAPESLLDPTAEPGPPPPHVVERGLKWPFRVGAESFISTAAFSGSGGAQARLYGTVLSANRQLVSATGQTFVAVQVRTVGFEAAICVPGTELPTDPQPGNIFGGFVYMVASIPSLIPDTDSPRSRWWNRRK